MAKWAVVTLLVGMCLGFGLWLTLDPQARLAAVKMWDEARVLLPRIQAGTDGGSLLAPVTRAFKDFADSVAGLWSPKTVRIEVPSIQIAP